MKRLKHWIYPSLAVLATTVAIAATVSPVAAGDPPPAGNFVIGDLNSAFGSQVTLWGAQWWKENDISGGDDVAAFKGYALDVDMATCSFTTLPGNSPPPPDGPLPAEISVLVTNWVAKTGKTITGTVTGVATVQMYTGYDDNPGHEGTGTVIGYTPCTVGGSGGGGGDL